jgi:uncharacterized protein (TIGR02594 family)
MAVQAVIDAAENIGAHATGLAQAGVKTVIRYYNNKNTPIHPTKCLTATELKAHFDAGLSVAVVFEQRAGAGGNIEDLTAATGTRDGKRALALAQSLAQPQGSAIYFAVDFDYFRASELAQITAYFTAARAALGGAYRCGSYGSGTVGKHLKAAGLVEYVWLSGSTGWSGTMQALQEGAWNLFQKDMEQTSPVGGFDFDGDVVNPANADFGQFTRAAVATTPLGAGSAALYRVAAKSGLNLRSGPGETFNVKKTIPENTVVRGVSRSGDWMAVDLEGDGSQDGYMFAAFLKAVAGGLPIALPAERRPIDVARAELALNVHEFPGNQDNPRIMMYHATTHGTAAHDEIAWCSSFVNYCVEQAGFVGTRDKWARSWHDQSWGRDVTATPEVGDIVVWRRHGATTEGGHVAFFLSQQDGGITVLGGNQSNSVCIQTYPVNGQMGFIYNLLSIRRGW